MQVLDVRLHEPESLEAACGLLRELGDGARVLAGGTDILVDLRRERLTGVSHLVSLRRIVGLGWIDDFHGGFRIGTLVTPNHLARDERILRAYPALVDAARSMAGVQIRNLATVGGNLAAAVPCSDLAPILIAVGSLAVLRGPGSERTVPLTEYFRGPRQTIARPDEILTHVLVPPPKSRAASAYLKFMLRGGNAVAVASVAAMVWIPSEERIADASVVLGAVAPIPDVARTASGFLVGQPPTGATFAAAARMAREESRPITDIRGTAEYRREIVEVLAARALAQAAERARKGGG